MQNAWIAKNSVELSSNQIWIDGVASAPLKCPHLKKAEFGKLTIRTIQLVLNCSNDYSGGIFVGDEALAQLDGDAGDAWDKQTLLFFDDESKSLILSRLVYSISDPRIECDGFSKDQLKEQGWSDEKISSCVAGKIRCNKSETFQKWNQESQSFAPFEFKGKVPARKLNPFKAYLKSCK